MARPNVTLPSALALSTELLTREAILARYPLTAPYVALLQGFVARVRALPAAATPPAAEPLRLADADHDRWLRALARTLEALHELRPDRLADWELVMDVVLPDGLGAAIRASYREEVGASEIRARRVAGNPAVQRLLAETRLDGTSLAEMLDASAEAAVRMGELLAARADSDAVPARPQGLLGEWHGMIGTLRRSVDLADYTAEDRALVIGPLDAAASPTRRRAASPPVEPLPEGESPA